MRTRLCWFENLSLKSGVIIWSKIHFATTSLCSTKLYHSVGPKYLLVDASFSANLGYISNVQLLRTVTYTRVDDVMASQTVYFYPRWGVPKSTTHPDISFDDINQSILYLKRKTSHLKENKTSVKMFSVFCFCFKPVASIKQN